MACEIDTQRATPVINYPVIVYIHGGKYLAQIHRRGLVLARDGAPELRRPASGSCQSDTLPSPLTAYTKHLLCSSWRLDLAKTWQASFATAQRTTTRRSTCSTMASYL